MVAQAQHAKRPFSVMAKPVGSHCNLRCDYCYYVQVPTSGLPRMSPALLEKFIRQYIRASPGPVVSFVWHGGEPTLAGMDFFRQALAIQKRFLPDGWQCWNNLQTNGVLLDEDWCAFLAENRFDVGLSIDGTAAIHDQHRSDGHSHGSYQSAASTIRRLQAHGVQPDLLCTVNSDTAREPLAVYQALREFGTGWIQFIPIVHQDQWVNSIPHLPGGITGNQYGKFLCAVFDEWSHHDLGSCDVQLFAETTRILTGGQAGLCWMAPTCGQVLVVEADGGVYSCDHYVRPTHHLGDITTSTLGEMASSPFQIQFGEDKRTLLPQRCLACPWLKVCNGGCPKDRRPDGINHLCDGLEQFFSHAVPVLTQMIALTRQGLAPAAIMDQIA
ncbi:MAG: anaerobic sulfatase maturase [Propionibacteriaceae bacterium]|nr:anaerobic sulfatase maturase [Propionibacteriaceae bacterium]